MTIETKDQGILKRSYNHNCKAPVCSHDPELTYTLPDYQTASGGADIMMHTMEHYHPGKGWNYLTVYRNTACNGKG
ncbi:MAG: iron-containing alcohol dehydrogenase [Lacrimispora sp.]